jgi:hypothetical protein
MLAISIGLARRGITGRIRFKVAYPRSLGSPPEVMPVSTQPGQMAMQRMLSVV